MSSEGRERLARELAEQAARNLYRPELIRQRGDLRRIKEAIERLPRDFGEERR